MAEPYDSNSALDGYAETPLHAAAWSGQLEEARELIKAGADVNHVDSAGEAAISGASSSGHAEVVRYLISVGARVDIVAKETSNFTPLHWAARSGSLETVKLLVEAGADPFACSDRGRIPRELAEEHGFHEIALFLREVEGE